MQRIDKKIVWCISTKMQQCFFRCHLSLWYDALLIQFLCKNMSSVNAEAPAKPRRKRRWLAWLLDIVLVVAIVLGVRFWQHQGLVDGVAPSFTGTNLQGQTVDLKQYRGKPVLLHFWASWCPMCDLEQDSISALHNDWQVVTVAFQSGEVDDVKRYVKRENIEQWTTIVDQDGKLAAQYGIHVVPTTYILDGKGNIRFREVGLTSSWGLKARLWLTRWLYP